LQAEILGQIQVILLWTVSLYDDHWRYEKIIAKTVDIMFAPPAGHCNKSKHQSNTHHQSAEHFMH